MSGKNILWQSDNSENVNSDDYVLTLFLPFNASDDESLDTAAELLHGVGFYTKSIRDGVVAFHEDRETWHQELVLETLEPAFTII